MIKLIAVDLDGTLLGKAGEIPPENADALRRAAEKGVKIVVSTGRILTTCRAISDALGCADYISTCNGSAVYRAGDKTQVLKRGIPHEETVRLIRYFDGFEVFYRGYGDDKVYYSRKNLELLEKYRHFLTSFEGLENRSYIEDDLPGYLADNQLVVDKFFVMMPDGMTREEFAEKIPNKDALEVASSWTNNLELTAKGVTKAAALSFLCEQYGLDPEEVMALGDSRNDIPMLQFAGVSVAMGNAEEEVRACCRHSTLTNVECGVAAAVKRFVLER